MESYQGIWFVMDCMPLRICRLTYDNVKNTTRIDAVAGYPADGTMVLPADHETYSTTTYNSVVRLSRYHTTQRLPPRRRFHLLHRRSWKRQEARPATLAGASRACTVYRFSTLPRICCAPARWPVHLHGLRACTHTVRSPYGVEIRGRVVLAIWRPRYRWSLRSGLWYLTRALFTLPWLFRRCVCVVCS